jgi:hypothetical protein
VCVDHGENVDGWGSGCDPSIGSGSCRRWDAGVAVGRDKRNARKQHVSNNKNPCPPSLHFQRLLRHHSRRLLTRTSPELVPHTSTCHMSLFGRFPSHAEARGAHYCSPSHQGPAPPLTQSKSSFTRSPCSQPHIIHALSSPPPPITLSLFAASATTNTMVVHTSRYN